MDDEEDAAMVVDVESKEKRNCLPNNQSPSLAITSSNVIFYTCFPQNYHSMRFIDEPKTLVRASQVSKHWRSIVRDESVWKRMCLIHGFDDWDREKRWCHDARIDY